MKKQVPVVTFHFLAPVSLAKRTLLKQFIGRIFKQERIPLNSLAYIFCNDAYLLNLNETYLRHDTLTDVITFRLSNDKQPIEGNIFISIERVRYNAALFGTDIKQELQRVIFHGALHLCGYNDKTKNEIEQMRTKEDFYLKQYAVSRSTVSH